MPDSPSNNEKRVHVMAYGTLKEKGLVTDIQDYIVRFAPIMRMILNGEVEYRGNIDWMEIREQVKLLTGRASEM